MRGRRNASQGKYRSLFKTPFGFGGVVAGEKGLLRVFLPFSGESGDVLGGRIAALYPDAVKEDRLTRRAALLLVSYFAGERVVFDVLVDMTGFTAFQVAVYVAVSGIPYGSATSYGEIAARIGRPGASRGVGGAMAANPLPLIIPCHRVLGASGELTGYSAPGGVVSKKWLLDMEAENLSRIR